MPFGCPTSSQSSRSTSATRSTCDGRWLGLVRYCPQLRVYLGHIGGHLRFGLDLIWVHAALLRNRQIFLFKKGRSFHELAKMIFDGGNQRRKRRGREGYWSLARFSPSEV